MHYKSYQHVEKLGSKEVEGILNGRVYLFYKIDGTNSCVWLKDDGTLGFGSRRRELNMVEDNAGFMTAIMTQPENKKVLADLKEFLTEHPNYIIYGEWLVKHTLKSYSNDAWRQFYIFDIYDTETNEYIPYYVYESLFNLVYKNLKYIPLIESLENPTEDDIKLRLGKTGDFLCTAGLGEGIVIKNYDFVNRYGRRIWAKVLTEDFRENKNKTRNNNSINKEENAIEYEIIKLMTVEHVLKEKSKIEETYGGWSDKYIFELLNRSFTEFWSDNWQHIFKKFKMPTVNFKKLKQLSDIFVKEILTGKVIGE